MYMYMHMHVHVYAFDRLYMTQYITKRNKRGSLGSSHAITRKSRQYWAISPTRVWVRHFPDEMGRSNTPQVVDLNKLEF